MFDLIKPDIFECITSIGVTKDTDFSLPPNPELGDLCFACFELAKKEKKDPVEFAKEIVGRFHFVKRAKTDLVLDFRASGPYVNVILNNKKLAEIVLTKIDQKNYGGNNLGNGQKVMIEYPSQNTHKEFHIGHLRNVCIGNSLVGLMEKSGYRVVPVNYINDFGSHVVKCLWYLEKTEDPRIETSFLIKNKQKWLGMIYAEANKYIAKHKEVKQELVEYQKRFEARDPKIMKLFQLTRQWSIEGFNKIHEELGVRHEKVFFESKIKNKGQKIVDELLEKKIATVGEGGAIIIDLQPYNLDVALLRKSSGSGVYLTSDLALAKEKFKRIKVDQSINITGTEQNFYFKQLFKILELEGFHNKMTHIGYGLVNRSDGKMSSRLGNVILYDDLKNEIFEKLFQETKNRHEEWNEKKLKEVTQILTQAVLKFTLLKHEAEKTISFDIKEATNMEGYNALYILYTVARINSMERKSGLKINKKKINFQLLDNNEKKNLLLFIANYSAIIKKALANYNPSVLVKYCFDLSKEFNNYYNKFSILKNDDLEVTKARLALCLAVRRVIEDALKILTIKTVEEM